MNPDLIAGRYELLGHVGQGGLGEVLRVRDRVTAEEVALKRLADQADTEPARLALGQGFSILSTLRHPNIVSVLDFGFDRGVPYLTMGIVEGGEDLLEAARDRPVDAKVGLLYDILRALSYLFRRGILHRDLKPANVLVAGDRVTILDFDLSAATEGPSRRAAADDRPGGTIHYMAPEVLEGEPAGPESDLYAVGVMAYEMFAGEHPFQSDRLEAVMARTLLSRPTLRPLGGSPRFRNAIGRALARRREDRFSTPSEFLAALEEATGVPAPEESALARDGALRWATLVGRASELRLFDAAVADAMDGLGSTWLVQGAEGVGKSRLLEEIRVRALVKGARVLRGHANSLRSSPFGVFRVPARELLLTLPVSDEEALDLVPLVPDIEALLGRELPPVPPLDPVTRKLRLLATVEALFSRIETPTVLQLEDLHLASEGLELLQAVNRIVRSVPLVVIGGWRTEAGEPVPESLADMSRVELGPLGADDLGRLVASVVGRPVEATGRLPALLAAEAGGNPLFAVEVLRAAVEEAGGVERFRPEDTDPRVFTGTLTGIMRRRLERLADDLLDPLEFAATVGPSLDLDVLAAAYPEHDLDGWLAACAEASVFEGAGYEVRFAHEHLRAAALEGVDPGRRAALSRRAAEAIEAVRGGHDDWAARLAHLWKEAGEPGRAVGYLMRVAGRTLSSGAPAEALEYGLEAVRLMGLDMPGKPHEVALAIGRVMGEVQVLMTGRQPSDLLELPDLDDPAVEGLIEALELIKPAAHMSQQPELFALSTIQGMALTLRHGASPRAPEVVATYAAVLRSMTGDIRMAAPFSELSVDLDRRLYGRTRATVAFLRSWFILHWLRPLAEVRELAEHGARDGFEHDDVLYGCFNAAAGAVYLAYAGAPPPEVEAYADRQAERIAGRVRVAAFHCLLERQVARALQGRTERLTSFTDGGVDEARHVASVCETANYNQIGYFHIAKMRLHLVADEASSALSHAERAEPLLPAFQGQVAEWEYHFLRGLASLVRAAEAGATGSQALRKDGEAALETLRRAEEHNGATFAHKARILEGLAAADDPGRAHALLTEAAEAARVAGFPQDRGLALQGLARALARAGDDVRARAAAEEAEQVYREWGATAAADHVRSTGAHGRAG